MLDKVKCECGHVNPIGTELCEACGKPFEDTGGPLNMRYEGVARRSQVYQKTIVDHVWNFFASVKIAVWLIAITLVASMFGTIYPQQLFIPSNANPYQYYPETYGFGGYLYVAFGLHNMYGSWWFVTLLVMIGISLVICSIDRCVPLYRALNNQKVIRHRNFLSRLRLFGKVETDDSDQVLEQATALLEKKRYSVRREENGVLGEKGRFSRWGPYINHIGLIIFLIGTLMKIFPGFSLESYIWLRDGEVAPVPGTTEYYIKSEGFELDTYSPDEFISNKNAEEQPLVAKEFKTKAVLYEMVQDPETKESELVEVKRHTIVVNDPLEYRGLKFFQSDFRPNELSQLIFAMVHKDTQEVIGDITVDLLHPESTYELKNGYEVELLEYYPDFELDQNKEPITKSNIPNNPAFIFNLKSPEHPEGEKSWIFLGKTIEMPGAENDYSLKMINVKMHQVSGLLIRKELGLPVIFFGAFVSMIGLIMGFYWQHRRIWIQREGREIWIGAHTNKNWFGLQKEVEYVIEQTGLEIDSETLDQEGNKA
ncbi:cytochrome c biogenesis protein ResB [Caldalkalibacillus mannanilyticus]|uniref:cytochrome c biogenesis protein ResB n=1 Tax=Caldalkalibacillus mannanilyticus TaxID=1418 RepID=UPI000468C786|nr:cytochrome c biogenesis protein ResB [Caldalkalibacillus mannanilyticus]